MYEKELKVAKEIAKKAGEIMFKYFDGDQKVERKVDNSMVTIADKEINHFVIEELNKNFDDLIIGEEESTGDYGMGRRWFCDPIDGTKAFVWGTPTAMFSLGLVIDGVPVLGVTYDPFLDRLYEGVKGQGSFCNGVPLKVSTQGLRGGIVAITCTVKKIIKDQSIFKYLIDQGVELAVFSGAVSKSALLARGKFVGYVAENVNAHDMAASHVIIEEAGGKITNYNGEKLDYSKPFLGIIVSNTLIHDELMKSVNLQNES